MPRKMIPTRFKQSQMIFHFPFSIFHFVAALTLLLFFQPPTTAAASESDASAAFDRGNQFYETGEFEKAADAYRAILNQGLGSAEVYFNLGNACFKMGSTGESIGYYLKALQLQPRDGEIRDSLQYARFKAAGGKESDGAPKPHWSSWLSINEWTLCAAVFFWASLLTLALRQFHPETKRKTQTLLAASLALFGVMAVGAASAYLDRWANPRAVVVEQEAVVRFGPLDESDSAFQLYDGDEVKILDEKNNWARVIDPQTNRKGWLKKDRLFVVD